MDHFWAKSDWQKVLTILLFANLPSLSSSFAFQGQIEEVREIPWPAALIMLSVAYNF